MALFLVLFAILMAGQVNAQESEVIVNQEVEATPDITQAIEDSVSTNTEGVNWKE